LIQIIFLELVHEKRAFCGQLHYFSGFVHGLAAFCGRPQYFSGFVHGLAAFCGRPQYFSGFVHGLAAFCGRQTVNRDLEVLDVVHGGCHSKRVSRFGCADVRENVETCADKMLPEA